MIRRPLVVANWKMHGSKICTAELMAGIAAGVQGLTKIEVVICPPFVYLDQAAGLLKNTPIGVGAQQVNAHAEGAYTGEISVGMLKDMACQYVIIGHSERRTLFAETDADVAAKCVAVMAAGLTPIMCVGETLSEREANHTENVIKRQVSAVTEKLSAQALKNIVIAYEPVWAIGTGKTATSNQAQEVHALIRSLLGDAASSVRILYGGSVKASNALALFAMPDIDGGLIGGASLQIDEFIQICQAANAT